MGISQPHIHKVLKGTRSLSPHGFDLVMKSMNLEILDLFSDAELSTGVAKRSSDGPCIELPILPPAIGPGRGWSNATRWTESYPVPCSIFSGSQHLALVRLRPDQAMRYTAAGYNLAVLDQVDLLPKTAFEAIYAIDRGEETVLRRIRRGARHIYLASDDDADNPLRWEQLPAGNPVKDRVLRGKVVWFGREKPSQWPEQGVRYLLESATSSYISRT